MIWCSMPAAMCISPIKVKLACLTHLGVSIVCRPMSASCLYQQRVAMVSGTGLLANGFGGKDRKTLYCTDSTHGNILMAEMQSQGVRCIAVNKPSLTFA